MYTPSWQDDRVFRLGAADRLLLLGYEKLGFAKDVVLDVLGAYGPKYQRHCCTVTPVPEVRVTA